MINERCLKKITDKYLKGVNESYFEYIYNYCLN